MLVTVHLYAAPGPQAPLIHLRRTTDHGLFDRFADHIDAIVQDASEPIEPNQTFTPPGESAVSDKPISGGGHSGR